MRHRNIKRERGCGKMRYRDKEEAVDRVHLRINKSDAEYLRVYECPHCFGWHMTSRPWQSRKKIDIPVTIGAFGKSSGGSSTR